MPKLFESYADIIGLLLADSGVTQSAGEVIFRLALYVDATNSALSCQGRHSQDLRAHEAVYWTTCIHEEYQKRLEEYIEEGRNCSPPLASEERDSAAMNVVDEALEHLDSVVD